MTYKIIRFKKNGKSRVIKRGLTLEEAKAFCSQPNAKGKNWFCGFSREGF